jgi:hypothetical protein
MITKFYSTPEYEKRLKEKYEFEVKKKQDEIDEIQRRTKKIQKFTARAYVFRPERVFTVYEGEVYCGDTDTDILSPCKLVEGGAEYILDTECDNAKYIIDFVSTWKCYKVVFNLDGHYGPTTCYCSKIGATPAKLEAINGSSQLILDDENKYDIICA